MAYSLSDLTLACSTPRTIEMGWIAYGTGLSSGIFYDAGYNMANGRSLWEYSQTTPASYTDGGTLYYNGDNGFTQFTKSSEAKNLVIPKITTGSTGRTSFFLIDKVWACSSLSSNTTATQTISSFPALPRYVSQLSELQVFLAVFSAVGSTASVATMSYTNGNDVSERTSQTINIPASTALGTLIPIYLQTGDDMVGVKSIQSLTFTTTSGTAGNIGLVIVKKIANWSVTPNTDVMIDFATTGLPIIDNDAALTAFIFTAGATTGAVTISLTAVEV